MGIMVRERALQQAGLMEVGKRGGGFGVELEPEPQLPSGWEKCLDMKVGSGLIAGMKNFPVLNFGGGLNFCQSCGDEWFLLAS